MKVPQTNFGVQTQQHVEDEFPNGNKQCHVVIDGGGLSYTPVASTSYSMRAASVAQTTFNRTVLSRYQPNLPPFSVISKIQHQNSKHEDRKSGEFFADKVDKRDRSAKSKEKREKKTEEEKEIRKERKLGRKRDRLEEANQLEMKRRREEDKMAKMSPNGKIIEPLVLPREKHHRTREISPYPRDRSHEKSEPRDKHRRSSENKRR